MANPYRYTTGEMLHYEKCTHFFGHSDVRLATDDELRNLQPCSTCLGNSGTAKRPIASDSKTANEFLCPTCLTLKAISQRAANGACRDCD